MMEFYKKRDFGTVIGDSFNFFKLYGKNYFKNYLLINGLLLIIMVVVVVFGYRELFQAVLGSNLSGQSTYLETYFNDNMGLLLGVSTVTMILFSVLMIINYLFPVFYVKRIASGQKTISTDEIMSDFKTNIKKIGKLCLGMIFIVGPLSILLIGFTYALILVIIGIFLLLFVFPTLYNVVTFLMYDYFNSQRGFFESLSYSIRSQFSYANGREKSPYWKYWGSTIIISIILYIISTIFTMIPMLLMYSSLLTSPSNSSLEQDPFSGSMGIFIFVIYGISMLVSLILSNLLYVSVGFLYYDSRTDLHQEVKFAEIESIGINE